MDTIGETPTPSKIRRTSKSGQNHQNRQSHFHIPPATIHILGQKMKTKGPRHQRQQKMGLSPPYPETDIRETNLAYHIEIALAGVKVKESLVIQWVSPRTLIVRGNIMRPDLGHCKAAEGDRLCETDTDSWALKAKDSPKVRLARSKLFLNKFHYMNTKIL
jgi:HSP20 family molecular chaperone IbpA